MKTKYKTLIIILIYILTINCNSQNTSKKVIKDFMDNIILKDSVSISDFEVFLHLLPKDKKLKELILVNQKQLNLQISNSDYKILTYNEFKKDLNFKNYKVKYNCLSELFCIVKDSKLLTIIVINDSYKIKSFFTGIIKTNRDIVPYII